MEVLMTLLFMICLTTKSAKAGPMTVTLTLSGDPSMSAPSVGDNLTLKCRVKGAFSKAVVRWKQSNIGKSSFKTLSPTKIDASIVHSNWKRSPSKYTETDDVTDLHDQSFQLTVHGLTYSDDGVYVCIAHADNRNGSDTMSLVIEGKPEINPSEIKRDGIIGHVETMNFRFTARPHVKDVEWFGPGDQPINLNISRFTVEQSQDTIHGQVVLSIVNFSREDAGTYRVVMINDKGSTEAAVELNASPFVHVVSPNASNTFPYATTAVFICRAANFNNTPLLTWMHGYGQVDPTTLPVKEAVSLSVNSTRLGTAESTLTIRGVTYDFIGSLMCTATDISGVYTDSNFVDVIGPPLIRSRKRTVRGDIGDTVRLGCNVTSNPPPTQLQWLFNKEVIGFKQYASEGLNTQTSLLMSHVVDVTSSLDYGSYMCQATNKYGTIGFTINLVALEPDPLECPKCTGLHVCDETLGECVCPQGYTEDRTNTCIATTLSLNEAPQTVQTVPDGYLWAGVGAGCVLVVTVTMTVILFICWRKRVALLKSRNRLDEVGKVNAAYTHAQYATANIYEIITRPADEFPRERLRFQHPLGVGKFGRVMKGEALSINRTGSWEPVAVKMCQESATDLDKEDLYNELVIIRKIPKHINVVSFYGACTYGEPLLIILEYVPGGDLRNYLRRRRPDYDKCESLQSEFDSPLGLEIQTTDPDDGELTAKELLSFALQTAKGMQHLESNNIVHRDVAARNILVGYNGVCKISDFGLARDVEGVDVYERTSKGPLPIRWMSPESLMEGSHSHKADVWAFGILLWEIVTLGASPYSTLSLRAVIDAVVAGKRLEKPQHCMDELYSLMCQCWEHLPRDRPSFSDLSQSLEYLLEKEADYIQLDQFQEAVYMVLEPESQEEKL